MGLSMWLLILFGFCKVASCFLLPELPWPKDLLEPHISQETVEYHYEKHHRGYVNKLNALLENSDLKEKSLEELVRTQEGTIFQLAAQSWNHAFYWNTLSPDGGNQPIGELAKEIEKNFGSFESFKREFEKIAIGHFGSGWAWLIVDPSDNLRIISTHDADSPLREKYIPLICCDVWEHAYYIDYRNDRAKYLQAFWNLVDWEFANDNFLQKKVPDLGFERKNICQESETCN